MVKTLGSSDDLNLILPYWKYPNSIDATIDIIRNKATLELDTAKTYYGKGMYADCDVHMMDYAYYDQVAKWLEELKSVKEHIDKNSSEDSNDLLKE